MPSFDDLLPLSEIKVGTESIASWPHVVAGDGWQLRYVMRHEQAFDFAAISLDGTAVDDTDPEGDLYSLVFHGVAYHDGIRHLYFDGEGDGYLYYPDLAFIAVLLAALAKTEKEKCPYADTSKYAAAAAEAAPPSTSG